MHTAPFPSLQAPALTRVAAYIAASFALLVGQVQAQTTPDAGTLLREAERQPRPLPRPVQPVSPQAPTSQADGGAQISVQAFQIQGNTLISTADLQAVLSPWLNQTLGFADLQKAAEALAAEYRRQGWLARPQLPAQDVSQGVVTIEIIEGKLGQVRVDDDGQALRADRAMVSEMMTARQKPGAPLNLDNLERSTNILNDTPGLAVTTILTPGKDKGESDAVVKVQDKPLFSGSVALDNQGARSTGSDKLTFSGNFDNPLGLGDQIATNANSSDGSDYYKAAYSRPFGHDGLRLGASASLMRYKLVGDMASVQAKGDAKVFGVNGSYPLLRSSAHNATLSAALDQKAYYNEANGSVTSDKHIHTTVLALTGDALDAAGQGGMTLWGVNLTIGSVDLSAAPTNEAADSDGAGKTGPNTRGAYTKLGYNLARLQRLSDTFTLWASLNGQWTDKNLDSSEKLTLGGPSGVRAYPVVEGSGDEGYTATLELRYSLSSQWQLAGFYDYGYIHQSYNPNYTGGPSVNEATLRGLGLGLTFTEPGRYTVKATVAQRMGDNPLQNPLNGKDGDGSLDTTRLWLNATLYF